MKKNVVSSVILSFVFLIIASQRSSSFTCFVTYHGHQNISTEAFARLGGIHSVWGIDNNDNPIEIFPLDRFINGVERPDAVFDRWPDWAHFGPSPSQAWDAQKQHRSELRTSAASTAEAWYYDPTNTSVASVYFDLGCNSHTVQDCYSHSNWVETHDPGVIANLEGPYISGLYSGQSKDSDSHPLYPEAWEDAVLATIREWYLFEDKIYQIFPFIGTEILNSIGVSSGIYNFQSLKEGRSLPLEGPYTISWYQTAIPHNTSAHIILLTDGGNPQYVAWETLVGYNNYAWNVGALYGGGMVLPDDNNARYQLQIITADGQYSKTSDHFFIRTPIYSPPSPVYAATVAWNKIKIGWQDNSDCESKYRVERKKEGDANFSTLCEVDQDITSAYDTSIIQDQKYFYRVKAVFYVTAPSQSEEVVGLVPNVAPLPPGELSGEFTYNRVRLMWIDESRNEQGFIIEKRSQYDSDFYERARIGPNSTGYDDKNVDNGTIYYYRVSSYNPKGIAPSAIVEIEVPQPQPDSTAKPNY